MIRALIVDDELMARNVMRELLTQYVDDVEVVAECENVPDAVLAVKKHKPDVVFLDIEMPEYTGFELLSFFDTIDFEIVFVTAYSQYAIKAFEVSAVDYILKPVQIPHLKTAVGKLKDKLTLASMQDRLETLRDNLEDERIKKIIIPMSDGMKFVKVFDIAYVQAKGSYAEVHYKDGSKLLTSKYLRFFEEALEDENDFMRVHRSAIVNLTFVSAFNKGKNLLVLENNEQVAVSRDKKSLFEDLLQKKML